MTPELLRKVKEEPGLCSSFEIDAVMEFYCELKNRLDLFRTVHPGPTGFYLDSLIENLQYYVERNN